MDDVILVDYDPRWPILFHEEDKLIRSILDDDLVTRIDHFGSTAIPGLSAKPIIDLLIVTPSLDEAKKRAVGPLEAHGYSYWRDNPAPHHMFFVKGLPPNGPRTHHIHMVEAVSPDHKCEGFVFAERLLFRDYLRTHPEELKRYAAIKKELARKYPTDREAYTDCKNDYVRSIMLKAWSGS